MIPLISTKRYAIEGGGEGTKMDQQPNEPHIQYSYTSFPLAWDRSLPRLMSRKGKRGNRQRRDVRKKSPNPLIKRLRKRMIFVRLIP